jgi:hypothetical protein
MKGKLEKRAKENQQKSKRFLEKEQKKMASAEKSVSNIKSLGFQEQKDLV